MGKGDIAVVGCGNWGRNYVRHLAAEGRLACVYDIDVAKTRAQLTILGLSHAYEASGWECLLTTPEVSSIIIATPAHTHFELALDALASGLHVLVEKPLALVHSDARQLADAARSADRVLAVGHLLRYHPAALRLGDWLASGSLGDIRFLDTRRVGPARLRDEHLLYSLAVHDIDMALFLGRDRPVTVTALGAAPSSADLSVLAIDFERNWRATVTVSWLAPLSKRDLTLVGSRMMAQWDQVAGERQSLLRGFTYARNDSGQLAIELVSETAYPSANPLLDQLHDFLRAVAGSRESRQRVSHALDQAVQGIGIVQAGLLSMANQGMTSPLA